MCLNKVMGTAHTSSQMKSTQVFRKNSRIKFKKPKQFQSTFTVNQENLPFFFFPGLELTNEKKGISSKPKAVNTGVNFSYSVLG